VGEDGCSATRIYPDDLAELSPGSINSLFGDRSVHFIKSTIDGNNWRALGSIGGGEVISADSY